MTSADQDQACSAVLGFELFNGQIITMDELETVASSITIDNDQIVALGATTTDHDDTSCRRRIDLQGRTVIPGLIDSHVHFVRAGSAPGHDVRLARTASSITELQELIRATALSAPDGQAIAITGGSLTHTQN